MIYVVIGANLLLTIRTHKIYHSSLQTGSLVICFELICTAMVLRKQCVPTPGGG